MPRHIQTLAQHFEDKLKDLRADTFWIFYDLLDDFATLQLECDPESEITKEKLRNIATKFRRQEIVYGKRADRTNDAYIAGVATFDSDEGATPNA